MFFDGFKTFVAAQHLIKHASEQNIFLIKTEKIKKKINSNNYQLIENEKDIDKWLKEAEEKGEFAIDTETTSLDPHQADLVGISLSTKVGHACYIPLAHKSKKNMNEKSIIKKIKPIL